MRKYEDIIRELDETPLPFPAAQEIAYDLINAAGMNDLEVYQMLAAYQGGSLASSPLPPLAEAICGKRSDFSISKYERSKSSLLACLIPFDGPMDGYFAEYIFSWAHDIGIDEAAVRSAF